MSSILFFLFLSKQSAIYDRLSFKEAIVPFGRIKHKPLHLFEWFKANKVQISAPIPSPKQKTWSIWYVSSSLAISSAISIRLG